MDWENYVKVRSKHKPEFGKLWKSLTSEKPGTRVTRDEKYAEYMEGVQKLMKGNLRKGLRISRRWKMGHFDYLVEA